TIFRVDPASGGIQAASTAAELDNPYSFARAPDGTFYVPDSSAADGTLFHFNPLSSALTTVVAGPPFQHLTGAAGGQDGRVSALDLDSRTVFRVDPATGSRTPVAAGAPLAFPERMIAEPPTCRGRVATIVGTASDDTIAGGQFGDVIASLGGRDR